MLRPEVPGGRVPGGVPGGSVPGREVRRAPVVSMLAGLVVAVWACGDGRPSASTESLASGLVARVGDQAVTTTLLEELVRARRVAPRVALDLAVHDALLSQEARRADPNGARWRERAALARSLLTSLRRAAREQGPATDEEIGQVVEARWWALARPRMVAVIHAVVLATPPDAAARELATRVLAAVQGVEDDDAFRKAALAVAADGLQMKVEALPPVTADGRAIEPDHPPPLGPPVRQFDVRFAEAAQRLERPGDLSPVVETPYGYHVMRASRIIEGYAPAPDELRARVQPQVEERRARVATTQILQRQRREAPPHVESSAWQSMQRLDPAR